MIRLLVACGGPADSTTPTDSAGQAEPRTWPEVPADSPALRLDADGDGWSLDEDCDDSRADVHPEAPELCDRVDQDCDGEVLAPHGCGEAVAATDLALPLAEYEWGHYWEAAADLTGDGVADLISRSAYMDPPGMGVLTLTGWEPDEPSTFPAPSTFDAYVVHDTPDYAPLEFGGDATGDGVDDLLAIDARTGIASVFAGPLPMDGAWLEPSDGDGIWSDGNPGMCWGCGAAYGDFDGDGLRDLAASVQAWEDGGGIWTFYGRDYGDHHHRMGLDGAMGLTGLGDVTGDGYDDLVVTDQEFPDNSHFISGPDLATFDGTADFAAAAVSTFVGEVGRETGWWTVLRPGPADSSQLITVRTSESPGGPPYEYLGFGTLPGGGFSSSAADGGYLFEDDGYAPPSTVKVCPSAFGDPVIAFFDGLSGSVLIPADDPLPERGTVISGRSFRISNALRNFDCADVTGDGRDDAIWTDYLTETTQTLYLMEGWEIPWDEDDWW